MKILSYGGGVQTAALAILIGQGKVETDCIVFADPGSEMPGTYDHIWRMNDWLISRVGIGISWVRAEEQPLYDYVWDRSNVIPVRVGHNEGLGRRQCTRQWKITPILNYARERTTERPIVMQIGISYDEIHRMKPSPDKDVVREWPLIDLRMTREDCRRVILDAGLPEPPKSSCYFCPLLPAAHFRRLAVEDRELFEKAAALEDKMNERGENGKAVYLTPYGKPLRGLNAGQLPLLSAFQQDGSEEAECEGTCFV